MAGEVLHHLAALSIHDGKASRAEQYLKQAVDLCAASYGGEHVYTVRMKSRLAQHYDVAGMETQAHAIYGSLLPHIGRVVQQSSQNAVWLAHLCLARSRCPESSREELEQSIEALRDRISEVPDYDNGLAHLALRSALIRVEQRDEAISTLRAGLQRRRMRRSYHWLAMERMLLQVMDEESLSSDIEATLRECIAYREKYFSPTHPVTLAARARFATWLVEQQRADECKPFLESCQLLVDRDDTSSEHKRLAAGTAVRILEALGELGELSEWKAKLEGLELEFRDGEVEVR